MLFLFNAMEHYPSKRNGGKRMKQTLEQIQAEIKELEKDPENICLYYATRCTEQTKCNGYSSVLICSRYVNIKHIRRFQEYQIK